MAASSSKSEQRRALVVYPESESYTSSAFKKAFEARLPSWEISTKREAATSYDLQLCDYDELDWDAAERPGCLTNAYMLRKALIRKSYLGVTVAHHLSKNPSSILASTVPATYPFQISHADELDELFYDELYDLGQTLDRAEEAGQASWWILKPAMADKGQGIRLFDSRESLQAILESFEDDSDDEEAEEEDEDDREVGPSTKVSLNTMRDWVIQEYIANPLLVDPLEVGKSQSELQGRKFHLRVYVLAVGALQVFVYTDILALFASRPYEAPTSRDADDADDDVSALAAHLTNTCLQSTEEAESSVFLLSDLVGKSVLGTSDNRASTASQLSQEQIDGAIDRIGQVVGETFKAALGMPTHFSVSEQSFEVFGIDLLLSLPADAPDRDLAVHLLEVNACPDFKQSGDKLHGIIERLFEGVLDIAVKPFFASKEDQADAEAWAVGERRGAWLKCLDEKAGRSDRPW